MKTHSLILALLGLAVPVLFRRRARRTQKSGL
jgi:hypothetical protein